VKILDDISHVKYSSGREGNVPVRLRSGRKLRYGECSPHDTGNRDTTTDTAKVSFGFFDGFGIAYRYIHRQPARPPAPLSPEYTAAIRKPEKRGPTSVAMAIIVARRASS